MFAALRYDRGLAVLKHPMQMQQFSGMDARKSCKAPGWRILQRLRPSKITLPDALEPLNPEISNAANICPPRTYVSPRQIKEKIDFPLS